MKHRILKNGEKLISDYTKKKGFGEKKLPQSFETAAKNIQNNFLSINQSVDRNSDDFVSEIILAVKLSEGFSAVSYEPDTFMRKLHMKDMGTKLIGQKDAKQDKIDYTKIKYVSVPINKLSTLSKELVEEKNTSVQSFSNDVRKIHSIDIENQERFATLLTNKWEGEKRIELVFHPLENPHLLEKKIRQKIGNNIQIKSRRVGETGPFYFNLVLTFADFKKLSSLNPIRAAHAIQLRQFDMSNDDKEFLNGGIPDTFDYSKITSLPKIAIVDGGIEKHDLFRDLIQNNYDNVTLPISENAKSHGSMVAGAAIFGDLSKKDPNNIILNPMVRVENIHVISTENDPDLWDVIDYLEQIVPKMVDVDVINLSIGPDESIKDDYVTRFTASLDYLAYKYNKLFVVASGNSGNLPAPLGRIQAPSDGINVLAVGACSYTELNRDNKIPSTYSSYGLGRIGAQVKPDVSDLGGSNDFPLILIGDDDYSVASSIGTSFSAPIVARKAAQLISSSTDISPLMAKALIIHDSTTDTPNINTGWGIVPDHVTDLYHDTDDEVTVMYDAEIEPSKSARLDIPIPINFQAKKFKIRWTIATMSLPNAAAADTYSASAITDTFIAKISDTGQKVYKQSVKPDKIATKEDLKWDTVTKQSTTMNGATPDHPHLIIHGQSRNKQTDVVKYAVVVSIKAVGSQTDLHSAIENEFADLEPITLNNVMINDIDLDAEIN